MANPRVTRIAELKAQIESAKAEIAQLQAAEQTEKAEVETGKAMNFKAAASDDRGLTGNRDADGNLIVEKGKAMELKPDLGEDGVSTATRKRTAEEEEIYKALMEGNELTDEQYEITNQMSIEDFEETGIPIVEKKNQIVFVGRDSYEKGIDILRNIEPKHDASVKYCTDLDWNDAMKIVKESKILIVPSRTESIPQVIKEAFFLQVPVIATNVGGIPELISNGNTGLLVSPENPQEMANTINTLLDDDETQQKLSKNAFDFINKNFSWDVLLEEYIKLYQS